MTSDELLDGKACRFSCRVSIEEYAELKRRMELDGYRTISRFVRDKLKLSQPSQATAVKGLYSESDKSTALILAQYIAIKTKVLATCARYDHLAGMYEKVVKEAASKRSLPSMILLKDITKSLETETKTLVKLLIALAKRAEGTLLSPPDEEDNQV